MNLSTDCYWADRCDKTGVEDYIDGVTYTIGTYDCCETCDMYDPLPKYKEEETAEETYAAYLKDMQKEYMKTVFPED